MHGHPKFPLFITWGRPEVCSIIISTRVCSCGTPMLGTKSLTIGKLRALLTIAIRVALGSEAYRANISRFRDRTSDVRKLTITVVQDVHSKGFVQKAVQIEVLTVSLVSHAVRSEEHTSELQSLR